MSRLEFIFTGSPRSGTGYTYKLLNSLGIPAGHESVFTVNGYQEQNIAARNLRADVSWLAAPHLHQFEDAKIIHIVRNPVDVVSSLLHNRILHRDNPSPFVAHIPKVIQDIYDIPGELDRCMHFFCQWTDLVLKHAQYSFRIEQGAEALAGIVGVHLHNKPVFRETDYNTRGEHPRATKEDISRAPGYIRRPFMALVKRFYYDI